MRSVSHSWFDLCGLVALLGWAVLALGSQMFNTPLDLRWFGVGLGLTWLGLLGGYLCARRSGGVTFQRILLWALAFRALAWCAAPVYEDDFYRYLWDGRSFAEEGSPYARTPLESFGDETVPTAFQRVLDHINHPHLLTIYPPLNQFIFLLSHTIAPGQTWPLKLFLTLADILLIIGISQLVSPRQTLLYAWCPLVLFESYFNLHPELFGVALIILAILHLSRRQHTASAIMAALAVGIKPLALPAALWIGWKCKTWERFLMVLTVGVLYAYFIWHDGAKVLSSTWVMAGQWEFNSFLYGLGRMALPPLMAQGLCLTVFALGLVFWTQYTARNSSAVPRLDWLYLGFFVCSSVVNAWYLLWILPWAILRPQVWTWTALAAVSLSYCTGQNLGLSELAPFGHPEWVRPLEIGAVVAVALVEKAADFFQKKPAESIKTET